MCLVSPPKRSQSHLKKLNKWPWQLLWVWENLIHHTDTRLEICLMLIVSPFKRRVKALAACSSHFLKKVLLDGTWWQCPVSEEMVKELVVGEGDKLHLMPLLKETRLTSLPGAIITAQSSDGVWNSQRKCTGVSCSLITSRASSTCWLCKKTKNKKQIWAASLLFLFTGIWR